LEARSLLILSLNANLDGPATLEVVRVFPNLSRVDLHYRNAEHAQTILSRVFPHTRDLSICPFINDLRIILDAPLHNNAQWKKCVRDIGTNIGSPLWMVTSEWPGGTFSAPITRGIRPKTPEIYP